MFFNSIGLPAESARNLAMPVLARNLESRDLGLNVHPQPISNAPR